jgi:hypothetical protein
MFACECTMGRINQTVAPHFELESKFFRAQRFAHILGAAGGICFWSVMTHCSDGAGSQDPAPLYARRRASKPCLNVSIAEAIIPSPVSSTISSEACAVSTSGKGIVEITEDLFRVPPLTRLLSFGTDVWRLQNLAFGWKT